MTKYISLFLMLVALLAMVACGDKPSPNASAPQTSIKGAERPNDTPTEAYKRLFEAVKSGNTDAIKAEFSKRSIAAAEAQAAQAKVPVSQVYKNGFTATTMSDALPEMRDERISGDMGAVEVWNARDKRWEDVPFVREASGWKLAIGDVFAATWKSPGMGRAAREQANANVSSASNGMINGAPGADLNFNSNKPPGDIRSNKKQ